MVILKRFLQSLPGLREFHARLRSCEAERDVLRGEVERLRAAQPSPVTWVPPGHFYSPIPLLEDLRRREATLFGPPARSLPGIDLNEEGQLRLLREIARFYPELPFPVTRTPPRRYFFENPMYLYSDAICLFGMLRHLQPRRVIEVGSGYSSAAILDTNDLFLEKRIRLTCIEPDPSLLRSLLLPEDEGRVEILALPVQEAPLARFAELQPGDILFVDSTHIVRTGGDVNDLMFRLLPELVSGVYVHFHDVFYPFEYPKQWVLEGRAWNEDYALRAFLQYNSAFEIALFNTFLETFHEPYFTQHMPLCLRNRGGSLWLRKR